MSWGVMQPITDRDKISHPHTREPTREPTDARTHARTHGGGGGRRCARLLNGISSTGPLKNTSLKGLQGALP
jgi:hypothetical protein